MKKDSWITDAIEQYKRDTQGVPGFMLDAYASNKPRPPQQKEQEAKK